MAEFETAEYIKNANEEEAARRSGKTPAKPEEKPVVAETPEATRKEKRLADKLREDAAVERGRRLQLEEMIAKGSTVGIPAKGEAPKPDDPEPKRADFQDDASFNRALGRWDTRQEVKKSVDGIRQENAQRVELDGLLAEIYEANEPAEKAIAQFYPDFKEKQEADDDSGTRIDTAKEHEAFVGVTILKSPVRAHLQYYFFDHPEELRAILDLNDNVRAASKIARLEGRLEKEYADKQATKPETAAERDARKPPPSESGSPKGGSAPSRDIQAILPNGRMNPAWEAMRNEETARR